MRRISSVLIIILSVANAGARSLSIALRQSDFHVAAITNTNTAQRSGLKRGFYAGAQPGARTKEALRPSRIFTAARKRPEHYDVTREAGSFFFDTVFKFRVPAGKRLHVGFNGGYTYYDRYIHGFGKAGSLGMIGGISIAIMRPPKPLAAGGSLKKAFFRLNADLISYPYRKYLTSDGRRPSMMDRYTNELSTRVYLDARMSWRAGAGSITARYLIGIGAGMEPLSGMPVFAGAGISYRFR